MLIGPEHIVPGNIILEHEYDGSCYHVLVVDINYFGTKTIIFNGYDKNGRFRRVIAATKQFNGIIEKIA